MLGKVSDTKFIVRQIRAGGEYGDPKQLIVTGPTFEEYLREHYRDGWTLFSSNVIGGATSGASPSLTYAVVLVQYEDQARSLPDLDLKEVVGGPSVVTTPTAT